MEVLALHPDLGLREWLDWEGRTFVVAQFFDDVVEFVDLFLLTLNDRVLLLDGLFEFGIILE